MPTQTPRLELNKFLAGETGWADLISLNWDILDASPIGHIKAKAQDTPNMTLKIAAGNVYTGTALIAYAGGNTGTFSAPTVNPRIDQVSMTSGSALVITAGAESASPTPPAYPAANIPICEVYFRVGSTAIYDTDQGTNAYIYRDVRPFVRLGAGSGSGVTGVHKTGSSDIVGSAEIAVGTGLSASQSGQIITLANSGVTGVDMTGFGGFTGLVKLDSRDGVGIERDIPNNTIRFFNTAPASMTNPMTSVGDIVRGGVAGAPTRLGAPADGDYSWRFTGGVQSYISLPAGRRSAGRIVAANNSQINSKNGADNVCDAVSDQIELAVAVAALAGTGGYIYLAEGTYIVDAGTTLQSSIHIVGAGMGATIIKVKDSLNAAIDVFTFAASGASMSLENLTIEGNKGNNSSGAQRGVVFQTLCADSFLNNVEIRNFRAGNAAVYIDFSGINLTLSDCLIFANDGDGLFLNGPTRSLFKGLTLRQNSRDLVLGNGTNSCSFVANTIQIATLQGVLVAGNSERNTFVANIFFQNGQEGVLVSAGNYNDFVGNVFDQNGFSANNTYAQLKLDTSATTYNTAIANNFHRGTGGNRPSYGIQVGANALRNKVVSNMTTLGGVNAPILDQGIETDLGAASNITVPPAISNWTSVLQSGATAANVTAGILLTAPRTAGEALSLVLRATPTPPYKIIVNLKAIYKTSNQVAWGLCWRSSSSGNMVVPRFYYNGGLVFGVARYSSPTVWVSSSYDLALAESYEWLRIRDDNTSRYIDFSTTGGSADAEWVNLFSESRTAYITPDQYGIVVNPWQPGTPFISLQLLLSSLLVG